MSNVEWIPPTCAAFIIFCKERVKDECYKWLQYLYDNGYIQPPLPKKISNDVYVVPFYHKRLDAQYWVPVKADEIEYTGVPNIIGVVNDDQLPRILGPSGACFQTPDLTPQNLGYEKNVIVIKKPATWHTIHVTDNLIKSLQNKN